MCKKNFFSYQTMEMYEYIVDNRQVNKLPIQNLRMKIFWKIKTRFTNNSPMYGNSNKKLKKNVNF